MWLCAVTLIRSTASEKILSDLPTLSPTYAANLSTWLFELQKYCRAQAYATCTTFNHLPIDRTFRQRGCGSIWPVYLYGQSRQRIGDDYRL